jgi:cyclopropane-fatty-acyl-phospholipid synthase
MLLAGLLDRVIRVGTLGVIDAAGERRIFQGSRPGPRATIRLHDRAIEWRLLLDGELALGEAWMDGRLTLEEGTLYDLLELLMSNLAETDGRGWAGLVQRGLNALRTAYDRNPIWRAKRNIAHHYDLSGELYELFLDSEREYTCAYFPRPDADIEEAQRAKERHIAAKLLLEPGMKVLDMGCGWGALGRYLARTFGVDVTGVTLSKEQVTYANERAAREGLADRCRFLYQDYREVEGRFDRIVSVGMLEHVGRAHYGELFAKIQQLLVPDGVVLVHSMGHMAGPGYPNPWIRKYIFPGGYIPALSEVLPALERSGLWLTDCEILRLHYAETLRCWREKFERNRARIRAIYDERFCRMWEFYLIASELSFRVADLMIFHLQIAKDRKAVPLLRDYMVDRERELLAAERAPQLRAAE